MPMMKRTLKDSVFTLMFSQPEYALQLYRTLHPEDIDVTEADCEVVTLENVLTNGQYNDLGLQVRNKLLLLTEAQSTFSINVALRMLLYVAASYKAYVEKWKLTLYSSKPVSIPRPELYVIYTGSKRDVPEVLRLSDLYDGKGSIDLEVKVCRETGTGDIIDQYVRFCKMADEMRKKYGRTGRAVDELIKRCRKEDVLALFLASRQQEVHDIMTTLFDQEMLWKIHTDRIREEAEEKGLEKGLAKGLAKGRVETAKQLMRALGLPIGQIIAALGIPEEEQTDFQKLLEGSAMPD